jgi:protein-disulfide isomerase
MKKRAVSMALVALALLFPVPGFPQPSEDVKALRREVQGLKEGQAAIHKELLEIKNLLLQKELQSIKELLQRGQAPAPTPAATVVSVDGAPFKGERSAKVTLIEFTDYQCPFCARHVREGLSQIEKDYIQTGKVRYVLRDFPLESIHPHAFKAAEAALCAGDQAKYWELHDRLFADQKALAPKDLLQHAQALGLDLPKFQQCLESEKYVARIRKDLADGQKAGVSGTPSFFLGPTAPNDSEMRAQKVLKGAQPYAAFKEAIDSLLSSQR